MELWPGVHRIEGEFNGNALCMYLLCGAGRTVLIDSGIPTTPAQVILPYLRGHSIPPAIIDDLVVTHASADHFGGASALREVAPQLRIIAHRLDVASIEDIEHHLRENFAEAAKLGCPWPQEAFDVTRDLFGPPCQINWAVEGGETIDLGEEWLVTLVHMPGHTPGHLGLWDERHQALFIGDAILGSGVTSLAGQLASPPPYFDVEDYLRTVEVAGQLRPAALLATHYPLIEGDAVGRFLSESRAFVARCDEALVAALAAQPYLTLCDAVSFLEQTVGPPGAVWRLTAHAHLRHLAAVGAAEEGELAGTRVWMQARRG